MESWENDLPEPSDAALEIAARCWCDKETGSCIMSERLAIAFAKRIQALMDLLDAALEEICDRDLEELKRQGVEDAIDDSYF